MSPIGSRVSYLADRDGAPQQELDEVLCMDARNVVVLLNELEDLGHVVRRRNPESESGISAVDLMYFASPYLHDTIKYTSHKSTYN